MKRHRGKDDYRSGYPYRKGKCGPRPLQPRKSRSQEESEKGLTTDDALQYLKRVRENFIHDQRGYEEFLDCMKDFKSNKLETWAVIERVKILFKGKVDLLLGFNAFLPADQAIKLSPSPQRDPLESSEAYNYVRKIKLRFSDQKEVYAAFLGVLQLYRQGLKTVDEVNEEIALLFAGHDDLLADFTHFLPRGEYTSDSEFDSEEEDDEEMDDTQPDEQFPEEPESTPGDPVEERGVEEEAGRQRGRPRETVEKKFVVPKEEEADTESDHAGRPQKRKSARRADALIKIQAEARDKLHGAAAVKGGQKVSSYFEQVKQCVSSEMYQDLLSILAMFVSDSVSNSDLQNLVGELLVDHQDLADGFMEVVSETENLNAAFSGFLASLKEFDIPDAQKARRRDVPDKMVGSQSRDNLLSKAAVPIVRDKNYFKPLNEWDLSNWDTCTPSYRRLPATFPRMLSSNRTEAGCQLLNDDWVSVTTGSEDYSFKFMRRNQYEESLFRCEDDRYELDMLIETTTATAKKLSEIMQHMGNDDSAEDEREGTVSVNDMHAINLRCIERIYGDHGLDIVEFLLKSPAVAAPVILHRLRQKLEEWNRCRLDMSVIWHSVYLKNHNKSLDHRSFYFKQQDRKSLSAKSIVAEIQDVRLQQDVQYSDASLSAIASGTPLALVAGPHMTFQQPDLALYHDIFDIMKFSTKLVYSSNEQVLQVMQMWRDFVEPLMGLPSPLPPNTDTCLDATAHPQSPLLDVKVTVAEAPDAAGEGGAVHSPVDGAGQMQGAAMTDAATPVTAPAAKGEEEAAEEQATEVPSATSPKAGIEGDHPMEHLSPHSEDALPDAEEEDVDLSKVPAVAETSVRRRGGRKGRRPLANGGGTRGSRPRGGRGGRRVRRPTAVSIPEVEPERDSGGSSSPRRESGSERENREEGNGESEGEAVAAQDEENEDGEEEEHGGEHTRSWLSYAEMESQYVRAKPLSVDGSKLGGHMAHWKDARLLYGNDILYVMLKLQQTLYDRLLAARTQALAPGRKEGCQEDPDKGVDRYAKYLELLYDLLDGTIDNSKYEDECRALLGTHSYVLFTMDKLVYKLVKQAFAAVSDDAVQMLLSLHAYSRKQGMGAIYDSVYHANARALLNQEDNFYRLEHSTLESGAHQWTAQLMQCTEVAPFYADTHFSDYMDKYVHTVAVPPSQSPVFLRRNMRLLGRPEDDDSGLVLQNVCILNGLECKISCNSSKVCYVLDTEDILFRKRSAKVQKMHTPQHGISKFRRWAASALGELDVGES